MQRIPSHSDESGLEADAEGIADLEAGRVVAHQEVAAWLDTWGTLQERPAPDEWFS